MRRKKELNSKTFRIYQAIHKHFMISIFCICSASYFFVVGSRWKKIFCNIKLYTMNSILLVAIALLVVSIVALKLKQKNLSMKEKLASRNKNNKKLADQNGIDPDEMMQAAGLEEGTSSEEGDMEEDTNTQEENNDTVTETTLCTRYPDETGNCAIGFELDESKCCVLPTEKVNKTLQIANGLGKMAVETAISESVEFMLKKVGKNLAKRMAKKLGEKTLQEGVEKLAKSGLKAVGKKASKLAGKKATKLASKMAGKALGKAAAKLGAGIAKSLMKAAFAPLIIFEVVSMALDMADVEGYNNFTENKIIQDAIKHAMKTMEDKALEQGAEVPLLFSLETAFPLEWAEYAQPALQEVFMDKAFETLNDDLVDKLLDAIENDQDMPQEVIDALMKGFQEVVANDPVGRDKAILEGLQSAPDNSLTDGMSWTTVSPRDRANLTPFKDHKLEVILRWKEREKENPEDDIYLSVEQRMKISATVSTDHYILVDGKAYKPRGSTFKSSLLQLYPDMATAKRSGVSLSKEGVTHWNETHKKEWFATSDVLDPKIMAPDGYPQNPVAIWTNKYYTLDKENPGTQENPNLVVKDLPEGKFYPLQLSGGHIVSYCEKKRNAKFMGGVMGDVDDANPGVDPKEFGVYFDDGTGELGGIGCVYTDGFCTRMGMKHKYNHTQKKSDCWNDEGAQTSEMLFGTTVTRGIQRGFHDLLGLTCDPSPKVTEYCENRKTHPKKKIGEMVGPGASWKCLSGNEAFFKCVECRDNKNELCDGKEKSALGNNCEQEGDCFCQRDQCNVKKETCTAPDPKKEGCDSGCSRPPEEQAMIGTVLAGAAATTALSLGSMAGMTAQVYVLLKKMVPGIDVKDPFNRDDMCKSGNCDNGWCRLPDDVKDRENGTYCGKDEHCASGLCVHGQCIDPIEPCTKLSCDQTLHPFDHPCNRNEDCKNDSYCDKVAGQRNTCRKNDDIKDRPVGEYCKKDDQCTSGLCAHNICTARIEPCTGLTCNQSLVPYEHPCNRNEDCVDGAHCDMVAGQRNTCRKNDDIKDRPNDEYCKKDEQCQSTWCEGWLCRKLGIPCTKKDECPWTEHGCKEDKNCDNNGYCDIAPGKPNKCRKNENEKDRVKGEFCTKDEQCAAGLCAHYECIDPIEPCTKLSCHQTLVPFDHACNRDADCKGSSFCDKVAGQRNTCRKDNSVKDRPDGEYCQTDESCASGLCAHNICTPRIEPCTKLSCDQKLEPYDHPCNRNEDCVDNSHCDMVAGQRNTCRKDNSQKDRPDGEYCKNDDECTSGLCAHNICTPKIEPCTGLTCNQSLVPYEHPCNRDQDCVDGAHCDKVAGQRNTCRKNDDVKDRPNNEYCKKDEQCQSNWCEGWLCRKLGIPCTKKDNCPWAEHGCKESKNCDNNGYCDIAAGKTNKCRKNENEKDRVKGEFCTKDEQCAEGLCAHYECIDPIEPCTSLTCNQTLVPFDHPCNRDADCKGASHCDKVAGQRNTCRKDTSQKDRPDGEYCKNDDECTSGLCAHNLCTPRIPACTSLTCDDKNQELADFGHRCNRNVDCVDNAFCDKVAGQGNTCRKENSVKNRAAGEYCQKANTCESNWCHKWLCKALGIKCTTDYDKCPWEANGCDKDAQCESGGKCINHRCRKGDDEKNRSNSEYCTKDEQCNSGICVTQVSKCTPRIPPCTTQHCHQKFEHADKPCDRDMDCQPGSYCNRVSGQRNTCRKNENIKNRPNGEFCHKHEQCASGRCANDYICRAKIPNGHSSQGHWTNCQSGHDHHGKCVQCKSHSHCPRGQQCHGYVCGTPVSCAGHWSGCHGNCRHRYRVYTKTRNASFGGHNGCPGTGTTQDCNPRWTPCPDGWECGGDNGCTSGYCHHGRCKGKVGEGRRCSNDKECTSGYCHHNNCTASRRRHDCNWFKKCPRGASCHHNWCIHNKKNY